MPWCPKCRSEYREGFTTCADCKETLVSELPPGSDHSAEAWVKIWQGDAARASLIAGALAAADIETIDFDSPLYNLGWELPLMHDAFRVLVRKEDAEEARKILQGMDRISEDDTPAGS